MIRIVSTLILLTCSIACFSQRSYRHSPGQGRQMRQVNQIGKPAHITVIAYYSGRAAQVDSFAVEKLTHIIFSFCHLKGNRLNVDNSGDSNTIRKLVQLKTRNPQLKVILSLGGWGGCKTCSDVFSTEQGREEFALSVKELLDNFNCDGIDLDWEYPAIEGYPGHRFVPEDKPNFTQLCEQLRKVLGKQKEISFAAGGFEQFLKEAIDWKKVMPLVDKVNLMTYDLINGNSTVTGHHTALYSTPFQKESTDNCVHYLDSIGVPRHKMVIGAAFYARIFEVSKTDNNGLYQPAKFIRGVPYKMFDAVLRNDTNFVFHRDLTAEAPYMYNAAQKLFVTFDDTVSMRLKTEYAIKHKLNGIMFWQLGEDVYWGGLLDAIDKARYSNK